MGKYIWTRSLNTTMNYWENGERNFIMVQDPTSHALFITATTSDAIYLTCFIMKIDPTTNPPT